MADESNKMNNGGDRAAGIVKPEALKFGGDGLTTVDGYDFEPIKGYPMLFWKGKRPFTSTQFYPAQLKESYGADADGWRNRIYWGDNLQVMSHLLKEFRGKINLIYIDPPFDSKADYKKKIQLRGQSVTNDQSAFEEKQYTDIWTNDEYLQFMYERLILMRELLSDTGSIYLHCDWHKSHYLRCIMDEIFSADNFRNQIVWKRSAIATNVNSQFRNAHDVVLFYTKKETSTFNIQFGDYSESSLKHFSQKDEKGMFQPVPLMVSGRRNGETGKVWRGIDPNKIGANGMHWIRKPEDLDRLDAEGKIYWSEGGGQPRLKYYLEEAKGVYIPDVWTDINIINSMGSESLSYPTQKPEALLERIVKASTDPGDIVFDCFMGSGTTQAVAMKLGRRFVGADINLGAVQTTAKRLISVTEDLKEKSARSPEPALFEEADESRVFTGFEVYNVNHYDVFRNPVQAKEILIEALEIQPLPASLVWDGEKDGRLVKIMPVNRIATRADLNELIANFDYKAFQTKFSENPVRPVEKILLVCMGHEPDLAAHLQKEAAPYKLDIEVVDILRNRSKLEFKRDSEAKIVATETELKIEKFYPMNLLQKLSLFQENVGDWRELVDSVMIDFNYDGVIFQPTMLDIPEKNAMVAGSYDIPADAGNIRVKITDLLSESLEVSC